MSQSLGKAVAAAETNDTGEVIMAMPLFKEGIMNQGGPADIMVRRIAIPADGGGGPVECPIDENVDAESPVVVEAFVRINADGEPRLRLVVDGLDGLTETPTMFRNAVTTSLYNGARVKDPEDTVGETFGFSIDRLGVPCAIQVTDADGSLEWGPWTAVDLTNLPDGYTCDGPIPPECE
jgi:hypothetical protein